jgi:mitochondrial inner membrane protease ATP23
MSSKKSHCKEFLLSTLAHNASAKQLIDSIEALGCKIPEDFIVCRHCDTVAISGGFSIPQKDEEYKPQIVICEDKFLSKQQIANTLVHELVHAYDFCKSDIDVSNCLQRACTEIRASSLSDECSLRSELMRGNVELKNGHSACVQRRAQLSIQFDDACKDKAALYVAAAFKECYADKSPFTNRDDL